MKIKYPALDGNRFSPDAFKEQIGKKFTVHIDKTKASIRGKLLSAEVKDNGKYADLVIRL